MGWGLVVRVHAAAPVGTGSEGLCMVMRSACNVAAACVLAVPRAPTREFLVAALNPNPARVLPVRHQSGGGGTVVLAPILDIGARLPPDEYARSIVPCVVRLFASNDRATRLQVRGAGVRRLIHLLPHARVTSCTHARAQAHPHTGAIHTHRRNSHTRAHAAGPAKRP